MPFEKQVGSGFTPKHESEINHMSDKKKKCCIGELRH